MPPRALDREVRAVARRLAAQDLELARGLLELHRANGWRRLGYASEQQFARERLGLSRSLIAERRSLALTLEKLPAIATALEHGSIGVEAAASIAKVATPATELDWIERATRRTVKHLPEETDAAGMARRVSDTPDCPPPTDQELDRFQELERAMVSGRVLWGEKVELGAAAAEGSEPRRAGIARSGVSRAGWRLGSNCLRDRDG